MRDVLAPFEDLLRRVDLDEPLVSADERLAMDGAAWDLLLAPALVRDAGSASVVRCDDCYDRHEEEVLWLREVPGDAPLPFIECADVGLVPVAPERLPQWVVDVHALSEGLAAALSCAGRVEELVPGRLWLLGRTVVAGRPREVFLGRRLGAADGGAVVGSCARLQRAVNPVVLVAGDPPPAETWRGDSPPVLSIASFVTLADGNLVADRAFLAAAVLGAHGAGPSTPEAASFPTPEGATWDEVRLVVREHDVEVTACGRTVRYGFAEAGFEDRRKGGVPDHVWRLLRLLALRGGVLPFDAPDLARRDRDNLKNLVSVLRRRLRALLQLPDDPFRPTRRSRRYEARFLVSTSDTILLPTPPGTRWEGVSIEEVAPDRVRFSFEATARTVTHGAGEDGSAWEAAERGAAVSREYDLVTLGLAERDGRPNAEGLALLAVLRGGGTVTRPADDPALLSLGGRLSRMAQLADAGPPFAWSERTGRWTARFDASSALADTAR